MSTETNATLLKLYRTAVEAGQDGIADMLEDVILEEMDVAKAIELALIKKRLEEDA